MKANDLMIGDWVEWKHATEEKYHGIYKIATIEEGWVDFYDEEGYCCSQPYDEIHPIPITKEFIEKNGYRFNDEVENGGDWEYYGIYKSCIYRTSSGWYLWILVGEMDGGNQISLNINYVHEMQHALRLCGVEKEINL